MSKVRVLSQTPICSCGEIGRHAALREQWLKSRASSNLVMSTNAPLAQMAVQLTCNQPAEGSNPLRSTN
jgi:hypothetical protein